ncbi:MAG: tyrosine-type recombinase/integrase [Candidatus Binatia bacterium]
MFPEPSGKVLDANNFRKRVFRKLLVLAKLRRVRIHDLRHTYASLLFQKGAPLLYVQEQLGHHSPAFTLSVYTHLLPGNHQRFVNLLGAKAAPQLHPTRKTPFSVGKLESVSSLIFD